MTEMFVCMYSHLIFDDFSLTDLVDSTANACLVLTEKGGTLWHLVVVSDIPWASWLHILPLFLGGSKSFEKASIFVPDLTMSNYFGLSHKSNIS
jgi:hypothetical protein